MYFWLAVPSVALGLVLAYAGVLRVLAAIEDSSTTSGGGAEAFAMNGASGNRGRGGAPAGGLLGWRRR